MGCARSKSKKKDEKTTEENVQTASVEVSQDSKGPQNEALDNVSRTNENTPIETVYVHRDDSGGTTSVHRASYRHDKSFSTEETVNLLKDEAYDILKTAIRKPATLEDAVKLVQSSCAFIQVNNDLLRHAVCLIRSDNISNMAQMIDHLMKAGNRSFSRQEAEDCIRALFIFSEDRAAKNSLLKVIHEKLEKNSTYPKSDRQIVCTPLDSLQLNASEHENVEVTVKKSVRQRSINIKDLEQRGLKAEDVIGKEVYIVSNPPEGLDEMVRMKAEEIMHAAGSIYSPAVESANLCDINATNGLRKILEAHKLLNCPENSCAESEVEETNPETLNTSKLDASGIQC